MTRRNFTPRTRKQDERTIARTQGNFSFGQNSDQDPSDIQPTAVAKLVNARGRRDSISGRTGSRLYSERTLPIRDDASGTELYKIGNDVSIGFSGGAFCESMNGDVIHGTRRDTGADVHLVIDQYVSVTEVTIAGGGDTDTYFIDDWTVVGSINAHYRDSYTEINYYLIGNQIYTVPDDPDEAFTLWTVIDESSVVNSESKFYKIKNNIHLFNSGGVFVLNDTNGTGLGDTYVLTASGAIPDYPLDKQATTPNTNNPSAYNVLYTYSRLSGDQSEDRNNEQVELQLETPPFALDNSIIANYDLDPSFVPWDETSDFSQYVTSKPIDDSLYKRYLITDNAYINYAAWVALSEDNTNPYMLIDYKGDTKRVYIDFSGVLSMKDVALEIEKALNDIDMGFRCYYDWSPTLLLSMNIYLAQLRMKHLLGMQCN